MSTERDSDDDSSVEEPRERKKARTTASDDDIDVGGGLASRPMPLVETPSASVVVNISDKNRHYPLIVILDQASLETVKNKKGVHELLSCDDRDLCKKLRKDPNEYRPDILHQELLALLDSPLNKSGMLKVYVQTKRRVLIDVHPSIRIPRTYKRFAGLMTQLLHKLKIKAGSESTTLLKVIKNPVSQYLPAGTRCYGFSCQGTLYRPMALARAVLPDRPTPDQPPTCFVVGAMATGHVTIDDHPYMEQMISISEYPLSGAAALSRLTGAAEEWWGIA
jgi:rRNA small subunit pseudouridine methyltransferase Nep1